MGLLLCPSRHRKIGLPPGRRAHLGVASSEGPGPLALGSLHHSAVIGQLIWSVTDPQAGYPRFSPRGHQASVRLVELLLEPLRWYKIISIHCSFH